MDYTSRRVDAVGQLLGVVLREGFYAPVGIVVRQSLGAAQGLRA